jgi:hypothetical protein
MQLVFPTWGSCNRNIKITQLLTKSQHLQPELSVTDNQWTLGDHRRTRLLPAPHDCSSKASFLRNRCRWHKRKTLEWATANGGFQQGANEIRPSTLGPDAGAGLFACVTYQPGDYITQYAGELRYCHPSTLTKEEKSYALQWEKNRASIIGLRQTQLTAGCGLGSLANDRKLSSVGRATNNAYFSNPDKIHQCFWLKAETLVKPGDEITVIYGPGFNLKLKL